MTAIGNNGARVISCKMARSTPSRKNCVFFLLTTAPTVALARHDRIIDARGSGWFGMSLCRAGIACGLGVNGLQIMDDLRGGAMADSNQQEFPTILGPDANFKGELNF